MLVIRLQRAGRKGHVMFRVVVQDSRRTPTSGKVVARLGSYDPHSKTLAVDKEKAIFYLDHGAQPSERIARLLKSDGVKLPDWVAIASEKNRSVRNADKRRSTRPEQPKEETPQAVEETPEVAEVAPTDTAEVAEEKTAVEAPKQADAPKEEVAEDTEKTAEPAEDKPAEETKESKK